MNFLIQRIWKVNLFIKNPIVKKSLAVGRGGGGDVARVSVFFFCFFFSKESKSEGVKVRENWLV